MTYGMMQHPPGLMSVGALMKSMDAGSVISKHALIKNIEQQNLSHQQNMSSHREMASASKDSSNRDSGSGFGFFFKKVLSRPASIFGGDNW